MRRIPVLAVTPPQPRPATASCCCTYDLRAVVSRMGSCCLAATCLTILDSERKTRLTGATARGRCLLLALVPLVIQVVQPLPRGLALDEEAVIFEEAPPSMALQGIPTQWLPLVAWLLSYGVAGCSRIVCSRAVTAR